MTNSESNTYFCRKILIYSVSFVHLEIQCIWDSFGKSKGNEEVKTAADRVIKTQQHWKLGVSSAVLTLGQWMLAWGALPTHNVLPTHSELKHYKMLFSKEICKQVWNRGILGTRRATFFKRRHTRSNLVAEAGVVLSTMQGLGHW